eukprot:scpid49000/ scgid29481/ 
MHARVMMRRPFFEKGRDWSRQPFTTDCSACLITVNAHHVQCSSTATAGLVCTVCFVLRDFHQIVNEPFMPAIVSINATTVFCLFGILVSILLKHHINESPLSLTRQNR